VDPNTIQELFAAFGAVKVRRMFGGAGLYADGVMFGLVSDGQIYLKADAATAKTFEREGCAPFEYGTKTGKRAVMSYWRLPDRLYDDPDELAEWARTALSVVRGSAAAKPKARRAAARKKAVRRPAGRRRR
jgi:DNA transformation protein and related proteins